MGLPKVITEGNLEGIIKGALTLITIAVYLLTTKKKSKAIKYIILIFGSLSILILIIAVLNKTLSDEIKGALTSAIFFSLITAVGIKGIERLKEIDGIIKEQKSFKKINYNIKGKEFNKKELEKIKDNLYNYFRFFEFNSYDADLGKLKIDIKRISKIIIEIDVEHTLGNESEIYYYDIVSRYESLKNSNFVDKVYLKYDKQFNNKIKLITRIITEEEVLNENILNKFSY